MTTGREVNVSQARLLGFSIVLGFICFHSLPRSRAIISVRTMPQRSHGTQFSSKHIDLSTVWMLCSGCRTRKGLFVNQNSWIQTEILALNWIIGCELKYFPWTEFSLWTKILASSWMLGFELKSWFWTNLLALNWTLGFELNSWFCT